MNITILKEAVARTEGNKQFVENLAKALNRSTSCISHKNNDMSRYTVGEINVLRQKYGLTGAEIVKAFFAD